MDVIDEGVKEFIPNYILDTTRTNGSVFNGMKGRLDFA